MTKTEQFNRKIGASRAALIKTCKTITELFNEESQDQTEFEKLNTTLEAQNNRLEQLNEEIDNIYESEDPDIIEDQYLKAEHYRTEYLSALTYCSKILQNKIDSHKIKSDTTRLPKLTLPTFNGDILQWQEFYESFSVAIDQRDISDIEKFQYLKSTLTGSVANFLTGLPLTSKNYSSALNLLKDRYGSEKQVLRAHVRSLLSLDTPNVKSCTALRDFVDAVSKHMRGLESLNVTSDKYDVFLCKILLYKMPDSVKHEYAKLPDSEMQLSSLLKLLETEAKRIEIISTSKVEPKIHGNSKFNPSQPKAILDRTFVTTSLSCAFCNTNTHQTFNCRIFLSKNPKERYNFVKEKHLCFNCLKHHSTTVCQSTSRCKNCNKKHNTLLHFEDNSNKQQKTSVHHVSSRQGSTSVLPTIPVDFLTENGLVQLGVLLDSGSDKSYINSNILPKLKHSVIDTEVLNVQGFGGYNCKESCSLVSIFAQIKQKEVKINLYSSNQMQSIANTNYQNISFPKFISCKVTVKQPQSIDIIIGADNFYQFYTGNIEHINDQLKLIETTVGWTYHGLIDKCFSNQTNKILFTSSLSVSNDLDIKLFWDNELAGILPSQENKLDEEAMNKFQNSITYTDKRYSVSLPWLPGSSITCSSYNQSHSRLISTTKRLVQNQNVLKYNQIISEYEDLGIVERCKEDKDQPSRYIPHHPVIKETASTTKLRIVFDASAKDSTNSSLNDKLIDGPNMFPNLMGIILRFRLHKYAITADVEKAFLQVGIDEIDRKFIRFLWYSSIKDNSWPSSDIVTFQFKRLPFGFRSSPFILNYIISHHLDKMSAKYPTTVNILRSNVYVDDVIVSHESSVQIQSTINDMAEIFSSMSMRLHKWNSNTVLDNFSNYSDESKVLGLVWNNINDTLAINIPIVEAVSTKRDIASVLCSFFDPMGWCSPFTNKLKLILQSTWQLNLDWDQDLTPELKTKTLDWKAEVDHLRSTKICRWLKFDSSHSNAEIHAYSDASSQLYSTCIYLVSFKDDVRYSNLLCSKSRVAPKKELTIPKLELLAALLSARLVHNVIQELQSSIQLQVKAFTDSQIVLSWIKAVKKTQPIFIQNRLSEIRMLVQPSNWFHVSTNSNPADIATRPKPIHSWLESSLWWEGPDEELLSKTTDDESEEHEQVTTNLAVIPQVDPINLDFRRFSNFSRLIAAFSFVLKFCKLDHHHAESHLLRIVQAEEFSEEISLIKNGQQLPKSSKLHYSPPNYTICHHS